MEGISQSHHLPVDQVMCCPSHRVQHGPPFAALEGNGPVQSEQVPPCSTLQLLEKKYIAWRTKTSRPSWVLKCSKASNPLWAVKKCPFLRWWPPLYIQDSILPKHLHPQHRGRHRLRQWTHHKAALLWQLGLERQWPLVCLRVLSNVHSPFFCVETL